MTRVRVRAEARDSSVTATTNTLKPHGTPYMMNPNPWTDLSARMLVTIAATIIAATPINRSAHGARLANIHHKPMPSPQTNGPKNISMKPAKVASGNKWGADFASQARANNKSPGQRRRGRRQYT